MTDARTDLQLDALLRRLDIPAEPAAGFVSESLDGLLPIARRARARDRGFVGRLLRDLRADRRTPQGATPRLALVMTLLVLALLAALVVAYIGSERRLPPPFGLAANGTIAYVNDNHVFAAATTAGLKSCPIMSAIKAHGRRCIAGRSTSSRQTTAGRSHATATHS